MKRYAVIALIFLLALLGWRHLRSDADGPKFRTSPVKRGNLTVTISATGTVEPEEVVDVGAQVAGLIFEFGKDKAGKPIDYGSEVEEGTVLAQIDKSLYESDVAQAQAQLKRAKADHLQAKARFAQADRDWKRAQKLISSEALSQASYDGFLAAYDAAQATLSVTEAGIALAEAALAKVSRNLDYCTIVSPVKGVIIDRRVNIGQTVVSSLNAPSLFLIAKDLTHMEVWVSVNEADIGNIHVGQKAKFTVDAFPGETYLGTVSKIRLNASMTQNVVTYTVEVATDNANGRLLPYLTANVHFEVSEAKDVLIVPNAALRWSPLPNQLSPNDERSEGKGKRQAPAKIEEKKSAAENGVVWIVEDGFARSRTVRIGGTDGAFTQIEGDIPEGTEVIIGTEQPKTQQTGTTNPFAPQVVRGGRGGNR